MYDAVFGIRHNWWWHHFARSIGLFRRKFTFYLSIHHFHTEICHVFIYKISCLAFVGRTWNIRDEMHKFLLELCAVPYWPQNFRYCPRWRPDNWFVRTWNTTAARSASMRHLRLLRSTICPAAIVKAISMLVKLRPACILPLTRIVTNLQTIDNHYRNKHVKN